MVEGPCEKVLQFAMPLKLIYNKNILFDEQNAVLEHCRKLETISSL